MQRTGAQQVCSFPGYEMVDHDCDKLTAGQARWTNCRFGLHVGLMACLKAHPSSTIPLLAVGYD